MKIEFQCNQCRKTNNSEIFRIEFPITEDLYYEFKCNKNHLNKYVVRNSKYGLLFESGIHALLDGYNREAVTSFAVALERFYEYIINFALVYDNNFDFNTVENFKKEVKLSERLYAVFCTIYLLKFKKTLQIFDHKFLNEVKVKLPKFDNKPVNFRNKIIHEGYIPTYDEAHSYGLAVSKYIYKISQQFITLDNGAFFNFMRMNMGNFREKINPDPNVSNYLFGTLMGYDMEFTMHDFTSYVNDLKSNRNLKRAKTNNN